MIKIFGMCILFLSARMLYENFICQTEESIKKTEDIILFANLLYVNVMELKMPLELGIEALKFKISPFIDEIAENLFLKCSENVRLSVREEFLKIFSRSNADKRVKREIMQFLRVVGTTDKETVLNYKKIAVENCEKYLFECKKSSEGKRKTAGAITFGASAVLTIILL